MNTITKVLPKLNHLIDIWCERRCLKPLCYILRDYPLYAELTEEWESILEALQQIRECCCHELAVEERKILAELITLLQTVLPKK